LQGRRVVCAPGHSPRLSEEVGAELCERLRSGSFPLRLPVAPLPERTALLPLD